MFTRKSDRGESKAESAFTPENEKKEDTTPAAPPPPTPLKVNTSLKGSSQMVPSVIGEDLTVEGNIISKGEVQLEGEIKGDVHCTSLVIGDKALVEGGVVAEDVIVRGRVVGSIRGHRVTLQSSSHVEGDIFHQSLAIEQGAYFEGKSRRSEDPIAEAKTSKSSSKQSSGYGSSTAGSMGSSSSYSGSSSSSNSSSDSDSGSSTKPTRAAE